MTTKQDRYFVPFVVSQKDGVETNMTMSAPGTWSFVLENDVLIVNFFPLNGYCALISAPDQRAALKTLISNFALEGWTVSVIEEKLFKIQIRRELTGATDTEFTWQPFTEPRTLEYTISLRDAIILD